MNERDLAREVAGRWEKKAMHAVDLQAEKETLTGQVSDLQKKIEEADGKVRQLEAQVREVEEQKAQQEATFLE